MLIRKRWYCVLIVGIGGIDDEYIYVPLSDVKQV